MTARAARATAIGGALVAWAAGTAGCKPDLDQTVSLVAAPQVLAVRSDPAEGAPNAAIHYTALVAAPVGGPAGTVDWAFCNAREPLAELGPVSQKCYEPSGDWFVAFGAGSQAMGKLPVAACRQFGPEVPEPQANQPPGRPVDPDATGGYYQPIRVRLPTSGVGAIGIASTRLTCGLAGTPDQVATFGAHYTANVNPAIASLTAGGTALVTDEAGALNPVQAGGSLPLVVSWAACPQPAGACGDGYCDLAETAASCPADCATRTGCAGAETYATLDLTQHILVTRREGMQVAWFATGGVFDNDRTGRDPSDAVNESGNGWHAPAAAGTVKLWVVLRDDRGGAGWGEYLLDVR